MVLKQICSWLLSLMLVTGCSGQAPTATPSHCNGYPVNATALPTCVVTDSGTLIQTPLNQQAQVTFDSIELTINGTIYVTRTDSAVSIVVIEGTGAVGMNNRTQSLSTGQQLTVTQADAPRIGPYELQILSTLPLGQLHRQVDVTIPTPMPTHIPSETPICPVPDGWTDSYQIQSGDTLTTVAQLAGISVEELQSANCITNPNSIGVGQVLSVPQGAILSTQPAETFTPSAVFFRADSDTVARGECTTLRWDIQNIEQLTLDGQNITDQSNQEVCPYNTITYTLIVDYFDNKQSEHRVTITVNES